MVKNRKSIWDASGPVLPRLNGRIAEENEQSACRGKIRLKSDQRKKASMESLSPPQLPHLEQGGDTSSGKKQGC